MVVWCCCGVINDSDIKLMRFSNLREEEPQHCKYKTPTSQSADVQTQEDDYVWATFQSSLFKFTDDVELRRDNEANTIHVRSGSRSGKSDLGVNRKRVEALRVK